MPLLQYHLLWPPCNKIFQDLMFVLYLNTLGLCGKNQQSELMIDGFDKAAIGLAVAPQPPIPGLSRTFLSGSISTPAISREHDNDITSAKCMSVEEKSIPDWPEGGKSDTH
ncbi:hypothetical protein INR49_032282 [Caranx melampygus]|nr:hypothetical protein INR49_032282 [Caranx melampygus]